MVASIWYVLLLRPVSYPPGRRLGFRSLCFPPAQKEMLTSSPHPRMILKVLAGEVVWWEGRFGISLLLPKGETTHLCVHTS